VRRSQRSATRADMAALDRRGPPFGGVAWRARPGCLSAPDRRFDCAERPDYVALNYRRPPPVLRRRALLHPPVSPHTRGRCHATSQSPRHPNTSGQTVALSSWRHRFSLPPFRGRFRRADHRRLRRFASDRSAHREPSACLRSSRDDYGVLKSGTELEPSSAKGNPGLCATSQAWPSGSIKIAA
jgi:hypothetical protein